MRATKFLHNLLEKSSSLMDKRISKALFACVEAAIDGAYLSIASLGRYLKGPVKTKNKIKRVDRLFANKMLHANSNNIYRDIAHSFIKPGERVVIVIDGSWLTACGKYQFLSASVPFGGRCLPILEKAFLRRDIMSPKTLKQFLVQLSKIIPKGAKPIVITDGAFRNPWFKLVLKRGWDYIGRANSSVLIQPKKPYWIPIGRLERLASHKPEFVSETVVSKKNPMKHFIYRYKNRAKGRKKNNLYGTRSEAAEDNKRAKQAKKPWILLSSLSSDEFEAKDVINIYKKRMQIEEGFRDLKDERNGLGFVYNRSDNMERINVALLIGAITRYLLWALGKAVKKSKFHFSYQANTIKSRNVLSIIFIARQFLRDHWIYHKIRDPWSIVDLSRWDLQPELV